MEHYDGYTMSRRWLFVLGLAACSSAPAQMMTDPCAVKPLVQGGSAELGIGTAFAPVVNGQDVDLQLGAQGLWMFVVSARVRDMNVGVGDLGGVINASALDQSGMQISLDLGCRVREFMDTTDGQLELSTPFLLPLVPTLTQNIEGAKVTIHLEVRDNDGRQATDQRSIVAHYPK